MKEAMKLARQLLWRYRHETPIGNQPHMICQEVDEAFKRIDEALAQSEQELVDAVLLDDMVEGTHPSYGRGLFATDNCVKKLYTTPQQRTWVGLADKQMRQICGSVPSMKEAVREAEAILKKENT